MSNKILVIGAGGQIGTELTEELCKIYGEDNVIAADVKPLAGYSCITEKLDVTDKDRLSELLNKHGINEIYHLAAMLSATAEKYPERGWKLNMDGLLNVLELLKERKGCKLFWPSSIAVFGPHSPRQNTPQFTTMDPTTVYGISKLAGERWCEYYFSHYNVDVRSIRYPGLIGYKSEPGGGTTDYAVTIFHEAVSKHHFECFLNEDTRLPMMYMPDAIRATIELMNAAAYKVKVRASYNLAAFSFTPTELYTEIKKHLPQFTISYMSDERSAIASTWPQTIDDSFAKKDWGWQSRFTLEDMTEDMLKHLL